MVESALEFARIARDLDYHAFVFSMKSSNPKVMIAAYRLLVARLAELDAEDARNSGGSSPERPAPVPSIAPTWNYPIHLGVTEAGEGEDARIKSAIGIGSLLADGIGDTIRVSLTEDSIHEIPVAKALVRLISTVAAGVSPAQRVAGTTATTAISFDPFSYQRRATDTIFVAAVSDRRDEASDGQSPPRQIKVGGTELVRVVIRNEQHEKIAHKIDKMGDYKPEIVYENANVVEIDPRDDEAIARVNQSPESQFVTIKDELELPVISAYRLLAGKLEARHPILLKDVLGSAAVSAAVSRKTRETATTLRRNAEESTRGPSRTGVACATSDFLDTLLVASTNIGSLLCDGIGDAVLVQGEEAPGQSLRLSYNILQAAGSRIFKTDYVACPSCGRTLFNLQTTTARIKEATVHLKGVKIAIMGCIVNGPGEMADADFGYVGGAPGKVNLYVGKQPVKFNIPEAEAVGRLKDLIREHGKWTEPAQLPMAEATA
jgi:(E)-4-hydroxy-3-methylbut-2-enyl-diphosphate synthase